MVRTNIMYLILLWIKSSYLPEGSCEDFGYDGDEGPTHWGEHHKQCQGTKQSPIAISTSNVVNKQFSPLIFHNFDDSLGTVTIENNGHTVVIKLTGKLNIALSGGPLKVTYQFAQLHFHWGAHNSIGSEHLIDQQSYPGEIHIVMFSTKYNEFSEASTNKEGLTVLSFLINLDSQKNENYNEFVASLSNVQEVTSTKTLNNFVSLNSLTTTNREQYFTYDGSLTTPPCSEVVTWIVFRNPVSMSAKQIDAFRSLSTKTGRLTRNYRPPQPINNRIVYYNSASDLNGRNLLRYVTSIASIFYYKIMMSNVIQ